MTARMRARWLVLSAVCCVAAACGGGEPGPGQPDGARPPGDAPPVSPPDDAAPPDGASPAWPPAGSCVEPVQDAVSTAGWPEVFIGTAADGCSDTADGAGTRQVPFCNPHLAMQQVTQPGTIVSFLDGEYRLEDLPRADGSRGGIGLPRIPSTADQFVVIRSAENASALILGSVRLPGAWTLHSASPRIFRISVDGLANDVRGLWQVVDDASRLYVDARRFRHVMLFRNGVRSHADVAHLADGAEGAAETSMTESSATRDLTWTKADGAGAGCGNGNAGCYLYLRIDDAGVDPNALALEAGQHNALGGGSSFMVLEGLHTRFTQAPSGQNSAAWFEGSDHLLVQDCSFGHVANANENAYALGIWFSNGSVIRNSRFFDSAYWGGVPNSKGLTFMCGGQDEPNWVCGSEIYHIPGQAGVGSKGGEANLKVVGNYIHDSFSCIEVSHERLQDGVNYPAGNWLIQQNIFERCQLGVMLTGGDAADPRDLVLNNLFLDNLHGVRLDALPKLGSGIHNNIFLGGDLADSCNSYGTCGAGVYFANNAGEVLDFDHILGARQVQMSHNLYFELTRSHGVNRNWTPNFAYYTLDEFRAAWSAHQPEQGSMVADPQLDAGDGYRPAPGSPVIGAGDGSFYGRPAVDIGLYPF